MTGPRRLARAVRILCAAFASCILFASHASSAPLPRGQQEDIRETEPPSPVEAVVVEAYLEKKVDPKYPELARQMRVQGKVILDVIINKKGKVREIRPASGHPLLVPAAMDAVKQWKYRPIRVNGHKVEAKTQVVVNFEFD